MNRLYTIAVFFFAQCYADNTTEETTASSPRPNSTTSTTTPYAEAEALTTTPSHSLSAEFDRLLTNRLGIPLLSFCGFFALIVLFLGISLIHQFIINYRLQNPNRQKTPPEPVAVVTKKSPKSKPQKKKSRHKDSTPKPKERRHRTHPQPYTPVDKTQTNTLVESSPEKKIDTPKSATDKEEVIVKEIKPNALAGDHIPSDQFIHKGSLVMPKNPTPQMKHEFTDNSGPRPHPDDRVVFDDGLNVVYDIGSEVEIIKSGSKKAKAETEKTEKSDSLENDTKDGIHGIGCVNYEYYGFENMLLDEDRNSKYRKALKKVITDSLNETGKAVVLDIGSGSGLLSLYAATEGASSVTAIELDPVICAVSKRIAKRNGMLDKITFINAESTLLDSLPSPASIMVSEIFDSELLGENVIPSFRHALKNLTTRAVHCIPAVARIWCAPIECNALAMSTKLPLDISIACDGVMTGMDGHWKTRGRFPFCLIADPQIMKTIQFNDVESLTLTDSCLLNFVSNGSHRLDGMLMWWELDMLGNEELIISTSPFNNDEWRNHWLPMLYSFGVDMNVRTGDNIDIHCLHDEVSLQFKCSMNSSDENPLSQNDCSCGWHKILSPSTMQRWNIYDRSNLMTKTQKAAERRDVLYLGTHSLLALRTARHARTAVVVDDDIRYRDQLASSGIWDDVKVDMLHQITDVDFSAINVIIFDPIAESKSSPMEFIQPYLEAKTKDVSIFPSDVILSVVAVGFKDLWRRKILPKEIDEFDYSDYYEQFRRPSTATHEDLELLPLWEEETIAKAEHSPVCSFQNSTSNNLSVPIPKGSDALVFCFRSVHNGEIVYEPFKRSGEVIEWDLGTRQWVYFLTDEITTVNIHFHSETGFEIKEN